MKRRDRAAILGALLLLAPAAGAEDPRPAGEAGGSEATADASAPGGEASPSAPQAPVYVPPRRGAPRARIGGATRGIARSVSPGIEALVPEEVALTLEAGVPYQWQVALGSESARLAGGGVERIAPPAYLLRRLEASGASGRPAVLGWTRTSPPATAGGRTGTTGPRSRA